MHSTRIAMGRGTVSTKHGQQRILSRPPDIITYIQKAVKSGTYRTNDEIREMNQELSENPTELSRIRWNVTRGSKIEDYPVEYQIMSLNPPMPFKPQMPLKYQRKQMNQYLQKHQPTDGLALKYLNRLASKITTSSDSTSTSSEEYYRKLLGVDRVPRVDSAMGQKSASVNKAYAFAIKQNELMKNEGLNERDALDKVEELLREDAKHERQHTRHKADSFKSNRSTLTKNNEIHENENAFQTAKRFFPDGQTKKPEGMSDDAYLSLLYSDDQRAFEGMISWTYRLQAVPYAQWTVGASTALDHWIAKRVLDMSEDTWLELIEGSDPSLIGLGRDIVMARHALFPETVLDDGGDDEEERHATSLDSNRTPEEIDVERLLEALGNWGNADEGNTSQEDSKPTVGVVESEEKVRDDKILELTKELQEWRSRNMEVEYKKWNDKAKNNFEEWLREYVTVLTPETSIADVDMKATREALLASPPQSQEDSDKFWQNIRDETAAEVFLQHLLKSGPPEDATASQRLFWDLPYPQQLEKLVNLGAIRQIADEYTKASDREKFLARYGDYLLEGVELDHLVPDATGPISGADIGDRLAKQWKITKDDRFKIAKIPFGSDEFETKASQRAREIFRAWNKFKAGRAHYEEKLFQTGLLGLRYEDESKKS